MTDQTPRFDPMTGKPISKFEQVMDNYEANPMPPGMGVDPHPHLNVVPTPVRMTRAQVMEIRRREREEGVDFPLEQTSRAAGYPVVARVRDLPFTDRTMLAGIPVGLRASLGAAMKLGDGVETDDVESMLAALDSLEDLGRALAIAGFIRPRLVLNDWELDGTDDCWLVDDLASSEIEAYRDFAMRDRGGAQQEVERLATFPGSAVEEAPAAGDRGGVGHEGL